MPSQTVSGILVTHTVYTHGAFLTAVVIHTVSLKGGAEQAPP